MWLSVILRAMKCKICGEKAIIHLRQHNLALCRQHFIEWFEKHTEKTIKKFDMFRRGEPIAIGISGGKDSTAVALALKRLGYDVRGIFIDLGIPVYSEYSRNLVTNFSSKFGIPIEIYNLKEHHGESLPELAARRRDKICSMCGTIKRYILNKWALEIGAAALVTGHNLDDEAATLLSNTLRWDASYLAKQNPVLPPTHPKFVKKVKPFAFFTEREIAIYAIVMGIEFSKMSCPFSKGAKSLRYKHVLNELEVQSPGTKLRFYREFLKFQKDYLKVQIEEPKLRECRVCGMPTTLEVCSFCRIFGLDRKEG